ncbi:MAG: hypothetical protein HFG89_03660 [Dorea sp.]|jgi:hypothetical protein|nr:hypothetical protein [Dorea sp.]
MIKELLSKDDVIKQQNNRWLIRILSANILVLAVLVAAIPGTLVIMRRADAQVALGNAKSLRMALDTASMETYASGEPFRDISSNGGVTEEIWREVITDSKVPGDFWLLQTDKSGYEVQSFLYREGDFTVEYCKEPLTYEVSYQQNYIQTKSR